jgi:hypothetical protein
MSIVGEKKRIAERTRLECVGVEHAPFHGRNLCEEKEQRFELLINCLQCKELVGDLALKDGEAVPQKVFCQNASQWHELILVADTAAPQEGGKIFHTQPRCNRRLLL